MKPLNTTREERDDAVKEGNRNQEIFGHRRWETWAAEDANTLEDELARVRDELSNRLHEITAVRKCWLDTEAERDKLREELNRSKDYVDELKEWGKTVVPKLEEERDAYALRNAEVKKERDKLREELEANRNELQSARRVIAKYKVADQWTGDNFEGGYAYVSASDARDEHDARFGGRDE